MIGIFVCRRWSGAYTVTSGATVLVYTYDGPPVATLLQVAQHFAAWIASQSWPAPLTAEVSVRKVSPRLAVDIDVTGGVVDLSGGIDGTEWSTGTSLHTITGSGAGSTASGVGASHTWSPVSGEPGVVSGGGSFGMFGGGSGTDARVPGVDLVLDESEAAALAGALRASASPRTAHVWDTPRAQWRLVALGALRQQQLGTSHMRVVPQVLG